MTLRAFIWVICAFVALSVPYAVLLSGERVEGRGLLWDFSKGLGFGALAIVGLQFAITARFRRMAHPFGIDIVYLFHRYMALGALALILGHFGILYFWFEPELGELNPLTARWELTSGRLALVCFAALVITSEFRKWLKLDYLVWRWLHVTLGIVAFAAAVAHVLGVGRFTSDPGTRALWLGVTVGWIGLLIWVRLAKPWKQRTNPWRVVSNVSERGGVHSLTLAPEGERLARWKPGQFAWLTLGDSPFGLAEHPFTIATPSENGPNVTMSIKPLGDFTKAAVRAGEGALAYLDGPYGAFSIDNEPEAAGFVMIAGGIGITPMMANLRAMAARVDQRPALLFYANKSWDDVTFREELDSLSKPLDLTIVHVLEEPPEDWAGETGMVSKEILARHMPETVRDRSFLLCGPPPMTAAVCAALLELGVPLARIDSEIFDMV